MCEKIRPFVIGLTGGIACGKTAAADYLGELGAYVVDADAISHALTAPEGEALPLIREKFGDGVFTPEGTLDRRAMADIVFSDLGKRRMLEGILHPMVQRRMLEERAQAEEQGAKVVVFNVPLLFETGMDALCDQTWCMTLSAEEQLSRVMNRDGMTRDQAQARVDSQMDAEERASRADVRVRTDRPVEQTRQELGALYRDLLRRLS